MLPSLQAFVQVPDHACIILCLHTVVLVPLCAYVSLNFCACASLHAYALCMCVCKWPCTALGLNAFVLACCQTFTPLYLLSCLWSVMLVLFHACVLSCMPFIVHVPLCACCMKGSRYKHTWHIICSISRAAERTHTLYMAATLQLIGQVFQTQECAGQHNDIIQRIWTKSLSLEMVADGNEQVILGLAMHWILVYLHASLSATSTMLMDITSFTCSYRTCFTCPCPS